MAISSKRKVAIGLVTLTVLIGGVGSCWMLAGSPLSTAGMPRISAIDNPRQSALVVRAGNEEESLLFLFDEPETPPYTISRPEELSALTGANDKVSVYRYRPEARELEPATHDDWRAATSPVVDAGYCTFGSPENGFFPDAIHDVPLWNGSPFEVAGRTLLTACGSPDESRAAVLSTTGRPFDWNPLPDFLSGPTIFGPRIHQFVELAEGPPRLGPGVVLSSKDGDQAGSSFWSPDGKYVIYSDPRFEHLWIVPAPPVEVSHEN